jgi:aspartate/methionine/tyrosine aminotransferase
MSRPAARIARRLDSVDLSGIREIYEALTAWAAAAPGRRPIPFHFGMPDFDTPAHIKRALYDAVADGFVKYTSSRGIPDLLDAVARKLARDNGITADPSRHLVVTCGANEALAAAILALVDPGQEVIIPDPSWPHYEYCIRLAGAMPVRCPLDHERAFSMSADGVASRITPRTQMIVVNSPQNPTGAVMSRQDIGEIALLAREAGLWLLSDEAYERLIFEGEHVSPASVPGMADTVVTVGCLSKTYAMTGWRLGYLCGPEAVADAVNRVHLYTVSCAVSFVQKAAIAALDGDQAPVARMVDAYRRRRDLIVELLRQIPGIEIQPPAGAFYVFPNIERFGMPSRDLALHLVHTTGVGAVHGSSFGPAGEGHLRIAYACSEDDIREGIARMAAELERLTPRVTSSPRLTA